MPIPSLESQDLILCFTEYLYYSEVETSPVETTDFEANGQQYQLEKRLDDEYYILTLKDAAGQELIAYNTRECTMPFSE